MRLGMAVMLAACVLAGASGVMAEGTQGETKAWIGHVMGFALESLDGLDTRGVTMGTENVVNVFLEDRAHLLLLPDGIEQADVLDRVARYTLSAEDEEIDTEGVVLVPETFEVVGALLVAQDVQRDGDVMDCFRIGDDGAVIDKMVLKLTADTVYYFDGEGAPEEIVSGQQYDILYDTETSEVFKMIASHG